MSKNNKKQHRTDGVFNSNNETYAVPQTSRNTPLSDYKFTDLEKIERESNKCLLFGNISAILLIYQETSL